jgi:hypothetical protein
MNIKKPSFKYKKLPYYVSLAFLTVGASLILGFLSFGGMYALLPVLPLAAAVFVLSVAYEGEIYLQNIRGALDKLLKFNFLRNLLAKDFLLQHFPKNTKDSSCPQFFKDYEKQLKLLAEFEHRKLNSESKQRKKQVETTLKDMEKCFARLLLTNENEQEYTPYAKELREWLAKEEHKQGDWQATLLRRRRLFYLVGGFSSLSALFMGLGTTYLVVEAFSVIPLIAAIPFAFWPLMVVPMAVIAGAAYGFLIYNTITDLVNNDTLRKWYRSFTQEFSYRNLFLGIMSVLLVALAIGLTICTAGTWWTIAKTARPLFGWMGNMPSFIMGGINPVVTGTATTFFTIQNTSESVEMLVEMTAPTEKKAHAEGDHEKRGISARENLGQILNPFRVIIKLTITPLRVLLFLGHLVSIALTADRMPGVPQIVAALIALISEGFEDAHYFIGHSHHHHAPHAHDATTGQEQEQEHHHHHDTQELLKERLGAHGGHNHDADIPTQILKTITIPLYALAAGWDYIASQFNKPSSEKNTPKALSWEDAWDKQRGNEKEQEVELPTKANKHPSEAWRVEHTLSLLQKYEKKHLTGVVFNKDNVEKKKQGLHDLQEKIRTADAKELPQILAEAKGVEAFNRHRLFAGQGAPTKTQEFIEGLSTRVAATAA